MASCTRAGVSNLLTKCANFFLKNLEWAMFYGRLDLDLVCFCKGIGVQIKMSNCAKKCTRAVGWTGLH